MWYFLLILLVLTFVMAFMFSRYLKNNQKRFKEVGYLNAVNEAPLIYKFGFYYVVVSTSVTLIAIFGILAFHEPPPKKDMCADRPADYENGYAAGQTSAMMGSHCKSCCFSYVQKHNRTANRMLEANECFCKGFEEGVVSKSSN